MKLLILTLFVQLNFSLFGQLPILKFEFQKNIDIWKPYTEVTRQYIENGGGINSKVFSLSGKFLTFNKKGIFIYSGLNYQRVNHILLDYQSTFNYPTGGGSSPIVYVTYTYNDPLDLRSFSDQFGINVSLGKTIHSNDKLNGLLSLEAKFYIIENYKYHYFSKDNVPFSELDGPNQGNDYFKKRYLFPILNINLNYDVILFINERISIGAKVNIGTNIYSDWDQFKKYAWLGVGLELGFGKSKIKV